MTPSRVCLLSGSKITFQFSVIVLPAFVFIQNKVGIVREKSSFLHKGPVCKVMGHLVVILKKATKQILKLVLQRVQEKLCEVSSLWSVEAM